MARMAAWAGVALGAVYLVFIGGGWFGIYRADLRLLTVSLAGLALAAWAVVAWRRPEWRPRSALLPVIAACLASLALSTVFSRVPRISAEYLGYAIVLAAVYLLLVRLLADPFFRRRIVGLAGLLFVVLSVAFVGLVTAHWLTWWETLGRLAVPPLRPEFESLTFGNPSAVLTAVALFAVPAAASLSWASRGGRIALGAVVATIGLVALLSGSRAGWLALALAGLIAVVALAASGAGRRAVIATGRAATTSARGRALLIGGAAALVVLLGVLGPPIARRLTEGGESLRLTYVAVALRLFGESPVVGTGPGTWVIERISYTQPTEVDYYIPHAHNVYAQTLAELGVVGVVVGLLLGSSVLALIVRAMRDSDSVRRRWGWASLIGLAYFAGHQVLDFYPNMPAILFAAVLPVAYLDATRPHSMPRPAVGEGISSKRALSAGVLITAVTIGGLLWQELVAIRHDAMVARANAGDWTSALDAGASPVDLDPDVSAYPFTSGLIASHAGDHAAAAGYFRTVASRDDLPEAWLNLAAEQAALGQATEAVSSLRSALRLGWQRSAVAVPVGDLALELGADELALQAFVAAAVTAPSLLADPWWLSDPRRAALYPAVVEDALVSAGPGMRWEIALMAGDSARAAESASNPVSGAHAPLVVRAWNGDDIARDELGDQCVARPLELGLLLWCARLEAKAGNVDRANDLRYLANAQIGGAYSAGAELRVRTTPAVGRSLEGNAAIFWGTYTYRRPAPWDILVPSLVHLTLQ